MSKATEIYVLNHSVRLLQPEKGFRTSLDSVMLGAACPAKVDDHILDMGCGVGGAGFCVLRRVDGVRLTGIELQADYASLARQNIALNGFEGRVEIIESDIRDFAPDRRFDHIICNPPYLDTGTYSISPDSGKATALGHLDEEMDMEVWVDAAFKHLKSRGTLTMIQRADMVDKIIRAMGKRFGGVTIIPLWPRAGVDAKRVIIRAIKDSRAPAKIHAGIVLHEHDGTYTEIADSILRNAAMI
jgi:tRNA1(Val) A37 N6-methylase TrmN6